MKAKSWSPSSIRAAPRRESNESGRRAGELTCPRRRVGATYTRMSADEAADLLLTLQILTQGHYRRHLKRLQERMAAPPGIGASTWLNAVARSCPVFRDAAVTHSETGNTLIYR